MLNKNIISLIIGFIIILITTPSVSATLYDRGSIALLLLKFVLITLVIVLIIIGYFTFFYKKLLNFYLIVFLSIIATTGFVITIIGVLGSGFILARFFEFKYYIHLSKEAYMIIGSFYILLGILALTILPIKKRAELGRRRIMIFFVPLLIFFIITIIWFIFNF